MSVRSLSLWSPIDNPLLASAATEAVQASALRQSPLTTLKERVRLAATVAYREAYSAAFRQLAYERGGVNAGNREAITAEATAAGNEARRRLYMEAGYGICVSPECLNLTSPGYDRCPACSGL